MSEENIPTLLDKPKKLWNGALRMVKGEDTVQLMESFTSEMTLVAEGLCEDQNRLRGEVNRMMNEEDRRLQKLDSHLEELNSSLEEMQREQDRVTTELRSRLAALEKQAAAQGRDAKVKKEKAAKRNWMRDLTILIVVAAVCTIAVMLVHKLV